MENTIQYVVSDRVATITLNRPSKHNAINEQMRRELQMAFEDVKHNPDVWVVVLTGAGDTFCSGYDVTEDVATGGSSQKKSEKQAGRPMTVPELYEAQLGIYKPIICAVNGGCYAQGAGLMINSDIVLMSDQARLAWPQVKLGYASTSGSTMGVHALPWPVAMKHILLGRELPPEDCLRWGLATEVIPHELLAQTTRAYAEELLSCAPVAVRTVKEIARRAFNLPLPERMNLALLMHESRIAPTEDLKEGVRAFKERRKPVWRNC